jgi:hypothetical protein
LNSSEARQNIIELAKNPQFAQLSQSQQRSLLDAIAANPDHTAQYMTDILNSAAFQKMDEKMRTHVIDLVSKNTMYPVMQNKRPADVGNYNSRLDSLDALINSKKFLEASEEDKWAQLKPYSSGVPNTKTEIDIL